VQAAQYAADRAFDQYAVADPKKRLVINNLEQARDRCSPEEAATLT
jgi:hypothetical protein